MAQPYDPKELGGKVWLLAMLVCTASSAWLCSRYATLPPEPLGSSRSITNGAATKASFRQNQKVL
ncbi:MAG: hypothetical protein ACI9KS_002849 [Sulfitobacter sp.]|jgi:hypothetical protein